MNPVASLLPLGESRFIHNLQAQCCFCVCEKRGIMAKRFGIDEHAGKLISVVFDLYGKPIQYCDVVI